ncbi:MAG: hypothetical protein KC620_09060 [Myxococcales bacterium]|nr:hypothetical protein [Myxococcales bacterium]
MRPSILALVAALLAAPAAHAEFLRFDLALTFNRFEQQVKSEIGGARGERLVEESKLGFAGLATWRFFGPLSAGIFARFDTGTRNAGRFVGLDDQNRAVVEGEVGGDFSELWIGPVIRGQWRMVFAELGYGALGRRWDDARADLAAKDGDTDAALRTSPTVAWLAAIGGQINVVSQLDLVLRVEYRVRYYDRRDEPLRDELVHGTQEWSPFIGAAWRID